MGARLGAARYLFVAAGWLLPWMRATLPARYWRKPVAATQGIALTLAAAHLLPRLATVAAVVVALTLLTESFGRDVWWLWRRRRTVDVETAEPHTASVASAPSVGSSGPR